MPESNTNSALPLIYDPWGQFKVNLLENVLSFFDRYSYNKLQKAMIAAIIVTAMEQKMLFWVHDKVKAFTWLFYGKMVQLTKKKMHVRNRVINKLTDDRKVNTLYECMSWYFGTLDADNEETIKCFTTDNYDNNATKPELLKQIIRGASKKFTFQGRTIHFSSETSQIQVDGEDFKRSNDTITLTIYTDNANDDWLESVFIKFVMNEYQSHLKHKRYQQAVYQNMITDNKTNWEQVAIQPSELHDKIVLHNSDKEYLMAEINHFINKKQWYIDHGYPYKLGILLYGEPGCGKTSIIRLISHITKRNTHYMRLSQIQDENQFNELLKQKNISLENTVLVLEDVDCQKLVHKRDINSDTEPIKPAAKSDHQSVSITVANDSSQNEKRSQPPLTLDTLLNVMDGILTTPGQIIVMTTNRKDVLDEALIRPGRIDVDLELKLCDYEMVQQLTKQFYRCDIPREFQRGIPIGKRSPAFIMNVFRRYKKPEEINQAFRTITEGGDDSVVV